MPKFAVDDEYKEFIIIGVFAGLIMGGFVFRVDVGVKYLSIIINVTLGGLAGGGTVFFLTLALSIFNKKILKSKIDAYSENIEKYTNFPQNTRIENLKIINMKHVHERNVKETIMGDTEYITTYKSFNIKAQPQVKEIGRHSFRFKSTCPICNQELMFVGVQTSMATINSSARKSLKIVMIYLKSIASGFPFIIVSFIFLFIFLSGILLSFDLTKPYAVWIAFSVFIITNSIVIILDAHNEISKSKVDGMLTGHVDMFNRKKYLKGTISIKLESLSILKGFPKHSFLPSANSEYSVAKQSRKINFLTIFEPDYIETAPIE